MLPKDSSESMECRGEAEPGMIVPGELVRVHRGLP